MYLILSSDYFINKLYYDVWSHTEGRIEALKALSSKFYKSSFTYDKKKRSLTKFLNVYTA